MHAVILAAGEGSRLGPHAEDVPKSFIDVGGETLYERQRAALAGHVDAVTVVLGYAAERVEDEVGDAQTLVLEDWDDYENAESLRRALQPLDDDVLVLNGDIVVSESVVTTLLEQHARSVGQSVVACIPGYQTDSTAIRCDQSGRVTDYGMIPGHRHAGLGIVDRTHLDSTRRYLGAHRDEWYPGLYTAVATRMVPIPDDHHIEINYPRDLQAARRKLALASPDGLDLRT